MSGIGVVALNVTIRLMRKQSSMSCSYDNTLFCFVFLQVTLEIAWTGQDNDNLIPHSHKDILNAKAQFEKEICRYYRLIATSNESCSEIQCCCFPFSARLCFHGVKCVNSTFNVLQES